MFVSGDGVGLDGIFFCVGIDSAGRIACSLLGTTTSCVVAGVSFCVAILSFFPGGHSSLRWTIRSIATDGVSVEPSAFPLMPMLLALLLVSLRSCSFSSYFSFSGRRGEVESRYIFPGGYSC